MIKLKEILNTVDVDGKELVLGIRYPGPKLLNIASRVYAKAWRNAVEIDKLPLQSKISQIVIEQGLWTEEKTKLIEHLTTSISANERKLEKGGIRLWGVTGETAQALALQMLRDRTMLLNLLQEQNQFYAMTAEAYAEAERINFLITECTIYNDTGEKYYKNLDDFVARSNEKASLDVSAKLMEMLYGKADEVLEDMPETKFLKKYGMVNDDGNFVNKEGKLVDIAGRLINEKGQYIDENGNLVDIDGKPLDNNFTPFLDEDGNPISE